MKRCGPFQLVLLAFLSTFVVASGIFAGDSAYKFSINGKPVTPQHYSLNGDPSVFAPGDVISIGDEQFGYDGLFLTLGDERECRFIAGPVRTGNAQDGTWPSRIPTNDGRLFLELPDGRRKLVGTVVTWTYRRQAIDPNGPTRGKDPGAAQKRLAERIVINPLDTMSPEEIHGLWGIYLNWWPEDVEQKLAHVNPKRVCIGIRDFAGVGGRESLFAKPSFPRLPRGIRYLVVKEEMSPGLNELSRLSQHRNLTFLMFESLRREPLDASLLRQCTPLRYLDVSGCAVKNCSNLVTLTELRYLNIERCQNIDNIGFTKKMHRLRTLSMGHTKVTSLSPLNNSRSIREIRAGSSAVRDLLKGNLPSLRVVNLVSTKVDAQTVARFRETHPTCKVDYGWAESLRQAVHGATRLRIRSGGTCHRIIEWEKTLAEVTNVAEINRFVNGIQIDESRSGGACACCGSPTFEFYAGERLLAMVGWHHEERLRWADGPWTGDGELTDSSQEFIVAWLAEQGLDGPRQSREAQWKYRAEQERIEKRYTDLIPPDTLKAVDEAESSTAISWIDDSSGKKRRALMGEAFRKYEKDAATSVELYLQVLGIRASGPWNAYYSVYDSVMVENVLPRFKGPELAQGTIRAMMDEEGVYGAARWLLGVDGWRNLDPPDREKLLPPLAKRSLQSRSSETRKKTMASLLLINSEWATALLRDMLSHPAEPAETSTKRTSSGWRIDLGEGDRLWSGEHSDAAWAAFCLAKLGDLQSLPAIERLAGQLQGKDKDLLNKAIQLLRDRSTAARPEEK